MSRATLRTAAGLAIATGALILAVTLLFRPAVSAPGLDGFARCLAEKQVTMYGASWCSHCANQKAEFGDSFRLVPYVECPDEPERCLSKGVNGYPTWILEDGTQLEGERTLAALAAASGCALDDAAP